MMGIWLHAELYTTKGEFYCMKTTKSTRMWGKIWNIDGDKSNYITNESHNYTEGRRELSEVTLESKQHFDWILGLSMEVELTNYRKWELCSLLSEKEVIKKRLEWAASCIKIGSISMNLLFLIACERYRNDRWYVYMQGLISIHVFPRFIYWRSRRCLSSNEQSQHLNLGF